MVSPSSGSSAELSFAQAVQGWQTGLLLAVLRRSPVDRQLWEPAAGVGPCLRRATVVRFTPSKVRVHAGDFAAPFHVVGSGGWNAEVVRAAAVWVTDADPWVTSKLWGGISPFLLPALSLRTFVLCRSHRDSPIPFNFQDKISFLLAVVTARLVPLSSIGITL